MLLDFNFYLGQDSPVVCTHDTRTNLIPSPSRYFCLTINNGVGITVGEIAFIRTQYRENDWNTHIRFVYSLCLHLFRNKFSVAQEQRVFKSVIESFLN